MLDVPIQPEQTVVFVESQSPLLFECTRRTIDQVDPEADHKGEVCECIWFFLLSVNKLTPRAVSVSLLESLPLGCL
jgi:hypothetical protein